MAKVDLPVLDQGAEARAAFRSAINATMTSHAERPFVCDGDPLACRVFIVGFNPATSFGTDFWQYWTDKDGFNRQAFLTDYLERRPLGGVRPRIHAMVDAMSPIRCLETNICSAPTRRASQLALRDRRTTTFETLFDHIRPDAIIAHSNQPMNFFRARVAHDFRDMGPVRTSWMGHGFVLFGASGPLWRRSYEQARQIGSAVASIIHQPDLVSNSDQLDRLVAGKLQTFHG